MIKELTQHLNVIGLLGAAGKRIEVKSAKVIVLKGKLTRRR